jgi:hypothetical protein
MKVTGQCHCGHVSYEAEIDPERIGVCHCTDCQRLTGSPFRVTAIVATEDLRLTGNPPKMYSKRAENGRVRNQYFCPECGSPLFTNGEDADADSWGIRWGSIDQRKTIEPKQQVWCRSAVSWLDSMSTLPARDAD